MFWFWRKTPQRKLWEALKPAKVKVQLFSPNLIREALMKINPDVRIWSLDAKYHLQPFEVVRLLAQPFEKVREYAREVFDCDDFALWFKVFMSLKYGLNSIGYVQGQTYLGYHAFNVAVCLRQDAEGKRWGEVWLYEPQAYAWYKPSTIDYKIERVII